jgi:diguanylate cyclase (GGDEF)-like protein
MILRPARLRLPSPVFRAAGLVFLLFAVLIGAVAFSLDRSARRSSWDQAVAELGSGARVASAAFRADQSNLRVQASELATSLPLQRAVLLGDRAALRRLAAQHHARFTVSGKHIGRLPPGPRISSSATITDGRRALAKVTIAVPIGDELLTLVRASTPMPRHAALLIVRNDKVIAGGPRGAEVRMRDGRLVLGKSEFAVRSAPLRLRRTSVLAVEPAAAIDAMSQRYRQLVLLAAIMTLALGAAVATRLGRPLVRVLGDVARLSRQAQTDALTGIANRHALDARLEVELAHAQQTGTSVSLVIADIDNFKIVNDGYGHQVGDEVIAAVARVMAASVRELDLPGRYGGEEFMLILPGARLVNARRTADRIRRAIGELEIPTPRGETVKVTASFGVAEFPTYAPVETLIEAADGALYDAKRAGKNRVATATRQAKRAAPGVPAPRVARAG